MFARLRTKLALLYGGLFGLVMIAIAVAVYPVVSAGSLDAARGQLEATSNAFQKLEALHMSQLRENARISATDFGFRSAAALAETEPETVRTALANLPNIYWTRFWLKKSRRAASFSISRLTGPSSHQCSHQI